MALKTKAQEACKSFVFHHVIDPVTEKTEWVSFTDSRIKFISENIGQGRKYWFRVISIGSDSQVIYSEAI